ncbi:Tetratricopeptide repeat-containing domain [Macleaya cordata]|uniref:Tetratricopeptide repeat-containing domain n=1 Tax=Macleaya cordata TaxID=56857 RepID=A0A200PW41_MACCD|nr:Tetratricopeptide repeat-containing domain [Macleaya cordata]
MRRASYSLLSKITSRHSRISPCRVFSRDFVSDITPIPSKENPSPLSHTHHKSCNRTHGLLILNTKTHQFQNNPSRNLDTLVDKAPQLSSRQRKKKEKSDIEEEFESAKTTDEILQAFEVMESAFDENDVKLGLACLKVGLQLDQEGDKPEKTLEFANRALNIFDRNDKASLPVAMTLQLMGSACYTLKRFNDSLGYLNRATRILSKLESEGYGKGDIGPVMHAVQLGLANSKTAMGRREEALVNHRRCLELKEKVLEPNSREVGVANRELAEAYVAVLNFKEALPHCLKALEIHKAQLGDNSVEVAHDRRLLGVVYTGLEEHQKALEQNELSQRVLKNWGLDSELLRAELDAANIQIALGKYDEAINSLGVVVQKTDKESKTRALVFIAMANALNSQNKWADARRCSEISTGILEKKESEFPVEVAEAYTEIAMLYETMNEFETAVSLLKRSLAILEKQPQELHSEGSVSARLGWLLLLTGKVPQAIPYLESAVERLKESFGSKHFGVGYIYNNLGAAYLELDRPQSAAQMFALAKDIMDVSLGPHHADSIDACQNLSKAYGSMGSYALAMEFQQRVIDAWESHGPSARDEIREAHRLLEQLKKKARGPSPDEVSSKAITFPRCAESASNRR